MIISLSKFKKGQKVYCHIDNITFLSTIIDVYIIGLTWYYIIDRIGYDGEEGLLECEKDTLSTNIDDKKVKIGKINE